MHYCSYRFLVRKRQSMRRLGHQTFKKIKSPNVVCQQSCKTKLGFLLFTVCDICFQGSTVNGGPFPTETNQQQPGQQPHFTGHSKLSRCVSSESSKKQQQRTRGRVGDGVYGASNHQGPKDHMQRIMQMEVVHCSRG